jgi:hypothetical protein
MIVLLILTSRVSLILTQSPQFSVQDHLCVGDGIAPISQWLSLPTTSRHQPSPGLSELDLDSTISDVFLRLQHVFYVSQQQELSTTHLHDLTCFVLHKLLSWSPSKSQLRSPNSIPTSQCIRYALALYMLIIHGPTYFSHAHLQSTLVINLKEHFEDLMPAFTIANANFGLWILSIGMVASQDAVTSGWFSANAVTLAYGLALHTWKDVRSCLEEVLWYNTQRGEGQFRKRWEEALSKA